MSSQSLSFALLLVASCSRQHDTLGQYGPVHWPAASVSTHLHHRLFHWPRANLCLHECMGLNRASAAGHGIPWSHDLLRPQTTRQVPLDPWTQRYDLPCHPTKPERDCNLRSIEDIQHCWPCRLWMHFHQNQSSLVQWQVERTVGYS